MKVLFPRLTCLLRNQLAEHFKETRHDWRHV